MRVRVLLFGAEADAVGRRDVSVEAGEAPTCADLRDRLVREHPALSRFLPAARFAVNAEFVDTARRISPGDEVALIGLVSGG
jgi:molybdopterin synthase sulfur carrier subunit